MVPCTHHAIGQEVLPATVTTLHDFDQPRSHGVSKPDGFTRRLTVSINDRVFRGRNYGITNYGDTLLIVEFRRYRSPPSHITELFVQLVRCHHKLSDHGPGCGDGLRDVSRWPQPQLLGLEP
jgi:hypothetical protein